MAITSAGVGSGLDLESIIKVSVDAENAPKVAALDKRESAVKLQLTAIGQIKSDLSAFESAVDKLKDPANFTARTAQVTQPTGGDVISVSASSTATAGNFDVKVMNLAQGSRAVQDDANSYSATTDVVTASGGTLTFTAGSKTFDVTLAAGATLADLRTAINDKSDNFGVSANIINTGGASPLSKLVLTSSETGTGNDLTVTNSTAELDKVSTTANGGGAGGLVIAAADQAKDATMVIDGITTTSATNTFTNAIQDITITALKADTTNSATLKVDTDKEAIKTNIQSFVDAYNGLHSTLGTVILSKTADATARGLKNALINQMGSFVTGAGNLQSLWDVGIEMKKDGTLNVNGTAVNTLDEALTNQFDDVGKLFTNTDGVATVLAATIDNYTKSGGIIKNEENALNERKKDIDQDRQDHTYRMDLFEQRLREKYANLDVLIAGMRSQGTAITSALSNLPGFTKPKS